MIVSALQGDTNANQYQLAEKLTKLYASAETPPVYTLVFGDLNKGYSVCQFDGRMGLNAVSFAQFDGAKKNLSRKTTYVEHEGIFLPSELSYSWLSYDKEGAIQSAFARTLRVRTDWMNRPVSETEFGEESLGLKYADRKFDEITGENSVYDDQSGFVPAAEFKLDESKYAPTQSVRNDSNRLPPSGDRGRRYVFLLNAVAVLGFIGFVLVRWYRKHPNK